MKSPRPKDFTTVHRRRATLGNCNHARNRSPEAGRRLVHCTESLAFKACEFLGKPRYRSRFWRASRGL